MNELGLAMGRDAYTHAVERDTEREFTLLGREWTQLGGVLGGEYNHATGLFASWLPCDGVRTMLEMGCGCGVASVTAALAGVERVTALDINPAAVRTTELNARRHGVAHRVRALTSDLFGALENQENQANEENEENGANQENQETAGPAGSFDLIFWNSPFIETAPGTPHESDLAYHFFDPGYGMHRRFLTGAARRLAPGGRLFLGFSYAMGNGDRLREVAGEAGFTPRVHAQESFSVPAAELGTAPVFAAHADAEEKVRIDFTLLELVR
ncbi:methyltransferase [Streptomyces zingiberis]|uniref:Methyltransferase n=1 Tax=Streptomyces zingiberis TaxID=2053010 RepID=A0ABX1C1V2_9ACTN|nr:methyltransferase [Streptomyces zingiberis]NJQ03816.1 methyltransferase [Streptomyces zingiberis]